MSLYIKLALCLFIFLLGVIYTEFRTIEDCEDDGIMEIHGKEFKCK